MPRKPGALRVREHRHRTRVRDAVSAIRIVDTARRPGWYVDGLRIGLALADQRAIELSLTPAEAEALAYALLGEAAYSEAAGEPDGPDPSHMDIWEPAAPAYGLAVERPMTLVLLVGSRAARTYINRRECMRLAGVLLMRVWQQRDEGAAPGPSRRVYTGRPADVLPATIPTAEALP